MTDLENATLADYEDKVGLPVYITLRGSPESNLTGLVIDTVVNGGAYILKDTNSPIAAKIMVEAADVALDTSRLVIQSFDKLPEFQKRRMILMARRYEAELAALPKVPKSAEVIKVPGGYIARFEPSKVFKDVDRELWGAVGNDRNTLSELWDSFEEAVVGLYAHNHRLESSSARLLTQAFTLLKKGADAV